MSEEDKNITFGTIRKLYDDIEKLERTNNEIFKANETLTEEIERLNNIINEAIEFINCGKGWKKYKYTHQEQKLLEILGSDKE